MATRTKIEGLPIQKEWKVLDVREGAEEPGQHGGTLKKFYVDFEGAPDVYWRRKMPATVKIGESYYGTVSEGKHGPMFKKESTGGGGGSRGGGSTSSSGGRSYRPEREFDPEKVARIGRAHAQSCAIELLIAREEVFGEEGEIKAVISSWTDWFAGDVDRAGAAAAKATGQTAPAQASTNTAAVPPPSATPPPTGGDLSEEREKFRHLLEDKAIDSYPAGRLADFVMLLGEKDRVRAWNGLGQVDTENHTLEELRQGYESHYGEAVPNSPGDEDDIPF